MGVFRDKIKKISFVTKVYRNISGADKREIMALLKKNLAAQEENRKLVERVISQQKLIKEKLAQSETIREDVINEVTDLNREAETKIAELLKNAEQNLTKSVDKIWKNYYDELINNTEGLDKKYFVSETMKEPSFYEGQIHYQILQDINKSMIENVKIYENSVNDFKDYVEMWVHKVKLPILSLRLMCHNDKMDKKYVEQIKRIDD